MNLISIGGWCGTKIALKESGLFNEASLPFDNVRSTLGGVIDCIDTNFTNFFPKNLKKDDRPGCWTAFVGKYIGFYHGENLLDDNVIQSFKRKFIRFDEKIKQNKCIFLRTIVRDNYNDEINEYKKLQNVIDKRYPGISYIICFIIPDQYTTQYYKHLDDRTFLFTLDDRSHDNGKLKYEYQPIFDFIQHNDLFNSIPDSNNIELINTTSRLWLVNGYPPVDDNN